MNRTPDDPTRLMNLFVAICGDQINSYRSKIEALLAALNANARFMKTRQDGGPVPLLCWEVVKRRRRSVGSATGSGSPHMQGG
jgi:hypothetical protein